MGTRGRRRQLTSRSHFPPLLQQPHLKPNFISSFPSQKKKRNNRMPQTKSASHPCYPLILPEVTRAGSDSQQGKQAAVGSTRRKDWSIYQRACPLTSPQRSPQCCFSKETLFQGIAVASRLAICSISPAFIPVSCLSHQVPARITPPSLYLCSQGI